MSYNNSSPNRNPQYDQWSSQNYQQLPNQRQAFPQVNQQNIAQGIPMNSSKNENPLQCKVVPIMSTPNPDQNIQRQHEQNTFNNNQTPNNFDQENKPLLNNNNQNNVYQQMQMQQQQQQQNPYPSLYSPFQQIPSQPQQNNAPFYAPFDIEIKKQSIINTANYKVKRSGKCLQFWSIIFMFFNTLALLMSIYYLFTLDSWHSFTLLDDSGVSYTIRLTSGGLLVLLIIKTAINLVILKASKSTFQLVTPIMRDIKQQELAQVMQASPFNANNQEVQTPNYKHSISIEIFQKKYQKLAIICVVLLTIGCLIGRLLYIEAAERFIHDYYKGQGMNRYNPTSYNDKPHSEEHQEKHHHRYYSELSILDENNLVPQTADSHSEQKDDLPNLDNLQLSELHHKSGERNKDHDCTSNETYDCNHTICNETTENCTHNKSSGRSPNEKSHDSGDHSDKDGKKLKLKGINRLYKDEEDGCYITNLNKKTTTEQQAKDLARNYINSGSIAYFGWIMFLFLVCGGGMYYGLIVVWNNQKIREQYYETIVENQSVMQVQQLGYYAPGPNPYLNSQSAPVQFNGSQQQ
ncbi:UNKNOWN [Stylonychia lemnae]|uniref:Transmembrane protein n=1 Tax=Stylonychia lemnae TaxID=5949 RepID=A0A078A0Z7_STYLE|nr:UNKNOWN [Stylonychia lemnae]|eukprot:CDW75532.1 UNKNOWN [Stylonychia lemnae]